MEYTIATIMKHTLLSDKTKCPTYVRYTARCGGRRGSACWLDARLGRDFGDNTVIVSHNIGISSTIIIIVTAAGALFIYTSHINPLHYLSN